MTRAYPDSGKDGRKKIVVVEDEESLLRLETILLSSKGYVVTGFRDGITAVERLKDVAPDLVILDVMVPGIDGFEICRRIKSDPATAAIPVVMLTARKSRDDMETGAGAGADAYITKPFKTATVMEKIEALLARRPRQKGGA